MAAMAVQLYKPFEKLNFSKNSCFLSGEKLLSSEEEITVFPHWLMQEYQLQDKPFKLLDESMVTYGQMKLPCSDKVYDQHIEPLEKEIQKAFISGYDSVIQLPELRIFQWIAKMVYGVLFNEIRTGMIQQKAKNEDFELSQSLIHKFSNLHIMLQSLNSQVVFEDTKPWSIRIIKLKCSKDLFNYRDEINTLTYSLGMKDFGIIVCLQDNGTNAVYHKEILSKISDKPLHPAQFEELSARFFYSNYLFNRLPEYNILPTQEAVYFEAMPLRGMSNKPLFDFWQNKIYAQVLENFWKPWGIVLFEILKDPENPLTYLLNRNQELIPAESVDLPS